jgi:hypothetical protein
MQNPELIVIALNLCILSFSYFWLFPRVAGANILTLAKYDSVSFMIAITISGILFYDSYVEFNALFLTLNWFWFTLVTFLVFETPFALYYFKKNNLWDSLN